MARKIIQIATCGVENSINTQCNSFLFALCDDGTLWEQRNTSSQWQQVSAVPSAPETIEAAATSYNNARDEICRCHFGSILVRLNGTGIVSKLKYCSMCGGKLSPIA